MSPLAKEIIVAFVLTASACAIALQIAFLIAGDK